MKDKILKIIHGPIELEPIYQLEFEYKKLSDIKEQDIFLSILKILASTGSEKEKFACFTTIELIGKAVESEEMIKESIAILDVKENKKLISPLLTLCAVLSTDWAIAFIMKMINTFKPISKEYSYYFDIAIRSIVATLHWKNAIGEIIWALENSDNIYVVDFIAYFKWKRDNSDEKELFQLIETNHNLINKINNLKVEIENRYVNNYKKLNKNN